MIRFLKHKKGLTIHFYLEENYISGKTANEVLLEKAAAVIIKQKDLKKNKKKRNEV
jgi:hypothetical protein